MEFGSTPLLTCRDPLSQRLVWKHWTAVWSDSRCIISQSQFILPLKIYSFQYKKIQNPERNFLKNGRNQSRTESPPPSHHFPTRYLGPRKPPYQNKASCFTRHLQRPNSGGMLSPASLETRSFNFNLHLYLLIYFLYVGCFVVDDFGGWCWRWVARDRSRSLEWLQFGWFCDAFLLVHCGCGHCSCSQGWTLVHVFTFYLMQKG